MVSESVRSNFLARSALMHTFNTIVERQLGDLSQKVKMLRLNAAMSLTENKEVISLSFFFYCK